MLLLSQVFERFNIVDKLEKSQLLWFEDILFCQMISAIVCDFPFIAAIKLRSISVATTICCGVRNPRVLKIIVEFVA